MKISEISKINNFKELFSDDEEDFLLDSESGIIKRIYTDDVYFDGILWVITSDGPKECPPSRVEVVTELPELRNDDDPTAEKLAKIFAYTRYASFSVTNYFSTCEGCHRFYVEGGDLSAIEAARQILAANEKVVIRGGSIRTLKYTEDK